MHRYKLQSKNISLLRLDSGFIGNEMFDCLEGKEQQDNYIVAARFFEPIQRIIVRKHAWKTLDEDIKIIELQYKGQLWDKSRRMIVVRQKIGKKSRLAVKTLKFYQDEGFYRKY